MLVYCNLLEHYRALVLVLAHCREPERYMAQEDCMVLERCKVPEVPNRQLGLESVGVLAL